MPSIPFARRGATNAIIRPSIYSLYVNLFMGVNRAVRVIRKKGGECRLLHHADTCFQCVVKRFFRSFFFFSFFLSFGCCRSLSGGRGGRCLQANLLWMFAVFVKVKESFFFLKDDNNIIEVKFIMEDFIRVVKKKKLVT